MTELYDADFNMRARFYETSKQFRFEKQTTLKIQPVKSYVVRIGYNDDLFEVTKNVFPCIVSYELLRTSLRDNFKEFKVDVVEDMS